MVKRFRTDLQSLSSPILHSESVDDFNRISQGVADDIRPEGMLEKIFVTDVAHDTWEILRYRRAQVHIIESNFPQALIDILLPQFQEQSVGYTEDEVKRAKRLADAWFTNSEAKNKVLKILGQHCLDESVIEARAIENSIGELEQIAKILGSLEARRNRTLLAIAEVRFGLAQKIRESSDRLIEGKPRALETKPPEAA